MKVHKGTYTHNDAPVRWVETVTRWEFKLEDLISGLCSHYIRHRDEEEDGPLPSQLSVTALVRAAREEFMTYGTNAVWTWAEERYGNARTERQEADEAWARGLILAVLPDLEI